MSTPTVKNPKAVPGKPLDRLHATLALDGPVTNVAMVSAKRAAALKRIGIHTVRDLLSNYPLRYIDMSQLATAQSAQIGQQCTIVGTIHEMKHKSPRPRLTLEEISLVDATGLVMITCFNQPWLQKSLAPGMCVSVSGKVEFSYGFKRMTNPYLEVHESPDSVQGLVLPVHPTTAGISKALMRRFVSNALGMVQGVYDPLPVELRRKYRLYSRYQAWRGVHNPTSMEDAQAARRRLRYEELFFVECRLRQREKLRAGMHDPYTHTVTGGVLQAFMLALPFTLTDDQKQAVDDIHARMAAGQPMNHLLLGDVGSGKTLVAGCALAAAANSGFQACMMGPTEVLVRQYGQSLGPLFDAAGITWGTLTGSTAADERAALIAAWGEGSLQVLFGTHALLEPDVRAKACSLVCIDEQQRFGVDQRTKLVANAPGADVLSLTATPIPRSLALACYGGMTLSYLHTAPSHQAGRTTKVCHFSEEGIAYDALRAALAAGQQAYVICPLIGLDLKEDSEDEGPDDDADTGTIEYAAIEFDLESDGLPDVGTAAAKHAEILQNQVVPQAKVSLLHGRMSSAEKDEVMTSFRNGDVDVLVSTTVVEVGVDVPNATVMIIEDADRFGLAQLHQLRGRVGRGSLPGQVFLVSRSKAPAALERLALLEQVNDGFLLSEQDLAMRREGDILGDRQHGASRLKLVNVMRDANVIEAAYADACRYVDDGAFSQDERTVLQWEEEACMKGGC